MGKWATYKKKHRKEWEQEAVFKGWLTSASNNNGNSYCTVCQTELRAHKKDLEKHAASAKHIQNTKKIDKSQQKIQKFGVSVSNTSIKRKELILASYIATHTSIRSVDHLTDIINKFNSGNVSKSTHSQEQEKFHLHRTKCTAIIKGVIGPALLKELIEDIGDTPFSIIVDESTDVSTEKLLCITIKYYSSTKNDIVTQFLTFISVVYTTAQDLCNAITEFFVKNDLNLKNLIGTDGASNMCGQHNLLFTLLKTNFKLEDLILVKCICHSLHLCSSKASEVFEDEIDFLLRETYNWFKNSVVRLSKYREIYDLINTDNNFSKFSQLSATRWLSRYRAVEKNLNQYLVLETHFTINADKERCHTAKLLADAYKNKKNKIILVFLQPILKQIYCLNLYFQKQTVDHFQAFEEINSLIWSLARQILRPPAVNHLENNLELLTNAMKFDQNYLLTEDADLGYELGQHIKEANLSDKEIEQLKTRFINFIKNLLQELIKRMPTHLEVLRKVRNFSPQIISNPVRPKFSDLPLHLAQQSKISDIETQYRKLLNMNWNDVFGNDIPDDPVKFWTKIITLKNAVGELSFNDLSKLALTALSLPSSNAIMERTFSIMNIIKSKLRNKMMLDLLNSIVRVKFHFYVMNICCSQFEPSKEMLQRFNSQMYSNANEEQQNAVNEINDVLNIVM